MQQPIGFTKHSAGLRHRLTGLITYINCPPGLARNSSADIRTSQSPAKEKRIKKYPFFFLRTKARPVCLNRINSPFLQDYNIHEKSN